MNEPRFTKGEWRVNGGDDVWIGDRVCIHVGVEDDAQLIAAAPDLYEALQDMLAGLEYIRATHGDLYGVGWDRAQDKARAALAKAKDKS